MKLRFGIAFVIVALGLALGASDRGAVDPAQRVAEPAASMAHEGRPSNETSLDDWWRIARHDIAESEYRVSANAHGLQAPNRAHGLRTYFESHGIHIHDRTNNENGELLRLSLARVGRGSTLAEVGEGAVSHAAARVEIARPGIVEWYENSTRGLEQGFTLERQSPGEGPLTLELAVEHARAQLLDDADAVVLATETGRRLRYGGLVAKDATGAVVPSRFAVPNAHLLRLVIDDSCAQYPLVIDPLLSNLGTADAMLESNQPDPVGFLPAAFGGSVSSAGDVNGDGYDDVIVGAPGWDGGDSHEGAAFVFLGSPTGIVGTDPTTANAWIESNQFLAQLGTVTGSVVGDVNNDGYDDIAVGAHFYESLYPGEPLEVNGAVFVFLGGPTGITGTDPTNADATIFANELDSDLGQQVCGAGDVNNDGYADIIVSVPGHGTPFPPEIPPNQRSGDHGAALIFHGGPAGIVGTGFDDADAVILSYEDTGMPNPPIYGSIGGVWGAGDVNDDGFDDVLVSGSEIALFLGSAGGIIGHDLTQAQSRIQPGGPMGFIPFGLIAAGAGDINGDGYADVVAAAPFRDFKPFTAREEGAAFVFLGGPTGLTATDTTQAHATFYGQLLAEWVGINVSGAGDIDNDGYDDILIGAREYPGSLTSEGVTYLFRGGPDGITATSLLGADSRLEARQSGAVVLGNNTALSASAAGDVDGDGFDDVIIGKGYFDNGEENEGAAFIFRGGPWPAEPNIPPVPFAGVDRAVVDGDDNGFESVTVDGGASFDPDGSIVSYAWYEGETLLGTEPELTTDLSTTGAHTLVLTVTDDDGITRGDPVIVSVKLAQKTLVFFDNFSGGLGLWETGGDVGLSSSDPFPDSPQVRIGATGAFVERAVDLSPRVTGIKLSFWGKVDQFAPSDELIVSASFDGSPFETFLTLTDADDTGGYQFYGGSGNPVGLSVLPQTASHIVLRFESHMTSGIFFLDDVKLQSLLANRDPIAIAGPDQSANDDDGDNMEAFALDGSASVDPDGTIVSHEWREGATLLGTGDMLDVMLDRGVHTVTLTVTDDDGAIGSDSAVITVFPIALPGDMNGDGVVDIADIPDFVDVMLGVNQDDAPIADVSDDGVADGRDLPLFVGLLLGG